MFRVKIRHQLTEDHKQIVDKMFAFKFIIITEIIGFSLILSLIIIAFLHSESSLVNRFYSVFTFRSITELACLINSV